VLRNASGQALETQIDDLLNKSLEKFSNEMETERKRRQKEVDSPEEYQRVSAACNGDLMQIVNDRLNLLEQTYPGSTKDNIPSAKLPTETPPQ
jgi:molecular chaperone GrpE (heat shock protein)